MLKRLSLVLFILGTFFCSAQSYIGFLSDNYSGVHGLISNPANIVDMPYRTDINLAGFSGLVGNDYYGAKLSDALKSDYDFSEDALKSPSDNNNIFGNVDVLGPSFSFNIDAKSAMALFTRGRIFFNVNEINGKTFENATNDFDENEDYNINEGDFYAQANAWSEIGVSYATILMDADAHFIKGGISIKYLQGYANGYAVGRNVTLDYDADGIALPNGQTTGSVTSTGQITYGYSSDFQDYEFEKTGSGFGIDIGGVYEWRPENDRAYKMKLGVSITDLGAINYKDGLEKVYDINNSVSQEDLDSAEGLEELLDNYYTEISSGATQKAGLPTAVHFNADWNFNNKFYLNLNTDFPLTSKSKANSGSVLNIVSLTPRYESKWFSFYSPISILQYSGLQWGAGFRAGPLYIGSGSILSVLVSDEIMGADVYAGLKLPLFKKRGESKSNDTDNDGVINSMDGCPTIPGPASNDGCPVN